MEINSKSQSKSRIVWDRAMLPSLVTEVHRYPHPPYPESADAYGFHNLVPSAGPDGRHMYYRPFAKEREPRRPMQADESTPLYETVTAPRLLSPENAAQERETLRLEGYRPLTWEQIPEVLQGFITRQQAPIEFQAALRENDPTVTSWIVLWIKGEIPKVLS